MERNRALKIDRQKVIGRAKKVGADVVGVADAESLVEAGAIPRAPLENARSAIVMGARQSYAALESPVVQMAQHDTIFTYRKIDSAAHEIVRVLEDSGHAAVAVPTYLPIDVSDEMLGMLGEVDHRRAAVEAGLGVYGLNNLLVNEEFGPRLRLATVLTTAVLAPTRKVRNAACDECGECVKACPANALDVAGKTDKRACGRTVFEFGLRGLMRFGYGWLEADEEDKKERLRSRPMRELWQAFMTGMYYTCFKCQAACPVGKTSGSKA